MKNVTKLLTATFIIGVFCTMTFAQIDAKPAGPIKGTVVKGGSNPKPPSNEKRLGPMKGAVIKGGSSAPSGYAKTSEAKKSIGNSMTFCWSSAENTVVSYRLSVWELKQGQNEEVAMRQKKRIRVYIDMERTSNVAENSDVIKACTEALQQTNGTTENTSDKYINSNLAGNNTYNGQAYKTTNSLEIVRAFTVDDFPFCAKESSCDYVFTVEALDANGKPINPNATPEVIRFSIGVDGKIIPNNGELKPRVEVLKSN